MAAKTILRIRPYPQTFHRYRAEEMCGPLPTTLYKILSRVYAERLVERGEMMWSTLTWFQRQEDPHRGDPLEGTRRYVPVQGLAGRRLERDGKPDDTKFLIKGGLQSRAAQSDYIFIYSTTLDPGLSFGDRPAEACVEIFEPGRLVERVRAALQRVPNARPDTLIHDSVAYWSPEHPLEAVWALPHRLTMVKHKDYEPQSEYRLAFGMRADVFDFENVECLVVGDDADKSITASLDGQKHRRRIRLGPLGDCCRTR